jgi:hypothetical protein
MFEATHTNDVLLGRLRNIRAKWEQNLPLNAEDETGWWIFFYGPIPEDRSMARNLLERAIKSLE